MLDVLTKINRLREERKWTEYRLAEESGLPQSTISSWYSKGMTPSLASLEKICDAFDITLSQFFTDDKDAVLLTENQMELLRRWGRLTNEQKGKLLEFLDTI